MFTDSLSPETLSHIQRGLKWRDVNYVLFSSSECEKISLKLKSKRVTGFL